MLLCQRKLQPHFQATTFGVLCMDIATVNLHHAFDDSQAQAMAIRAHGIATTEEWPE
jgi:hypothetical protein